MAARTLETGTPDRPSLDEATPHVHTSLTEDHRNAVAAFVARRKPEFSGR